MEEIIHASAKACEHRQGILLRYFNPSATRRSGKIGENLSGIPIHLMSFIFQVATA